MQSSKSTKVPYSSSVVHRFVSIAALLKRRSSLRKPHKQGQLDKIRHRLKHISIFLQWENSGKISVPNMDSRSRPSHCR